MEHFKTSENPLALAAFTFIIPIKLSHRPLWWTQTQTQPLPQSVNLYHIGAAPKPSSMANNHHHHQHHNQHHHSEAPADDFLEHLLGIPPYATASSDVGLSGGPQSHHMMGLQLSSSADGSVQGHVGQQEFHVSGFPLGLSLDQGKPGSGFLKLDEASGSVKRFMENGTDGRSAPSVKNTFHAQPLQNNSMPAAPHAPAMRPRVRARRGQATDPHSIAERLRRERIAERIRALQELVPSVNKTDRAAMLDEIVDYVKFLRLQVKVLSMSRLGGAGAVAPLVTDIPLSSVEEDASEEGRNQPVWEKWSNDGTEQQVAKLMVENIGAAMQFLQSKDLCIMPISLASVIYHTPQPDASSLVKPERNPPS